MSLFDTIKERVKTRYSDYRTEKLADEAAEREAARKFKAERRRLMVANATKAAQNDLKQNPANYTRGGFGSRLASGVSNALREGRERNRANGRGSMFDSSYDMSTGKYSKKRQ